MQLFSWGTSQDLGPPAKVLLYTQQALGQCVVALTRDCVKFKTMGLERFLADAHHSSFAQWVVQHDILPESKTILAESDLILRTRIFFFGTWPHLPAKSSRSC
jgi:hypothetical protein